MGISGCGMDWPIRGFLGSRGWCSWLVSNPIIRGGLNVVRRHSGECMVAAEHRDFLVELVVKWSGGGEGMVVFLPVLLLWYRWSPQPRRVSAICPHQAARFGSAWHGRGTVTAQSWNSQLFLLVLGFCGGHLSGSRQVPCHLGGDVHLCRGHHSP